MCTLCSKDVCTTAHILETCKVSLQQGRYIFTHHTVLCSVTQAIKAFNVNIKEAVPIPAKSSIKFLKKGPKLSQRKISPIGILHHTSDWVLLVDLNSNYCIPVHIAFTQLRPDITTVSGSLRKIHTEMLSFKNNHKI